MNSNTFLRVLIFLNLSYMLHAVTMVRFTAHCCVVRSIHQASVPEKVFGLLLTFFFTTAAYLHSTLNLATCTADTSTVM